MYFEVAREEVNSHTVFLSGIALLGVTAAAVQQSPRQYYQPHPPSSQVWHPSGKMLWQWQLTTPVNLSIEASVYDIDLFENQASVVAALHAAGRRAICYVDVGTWEEWRSDASSFPEPVKGKSNGWPGERWLDIRKIGVLGPILRARLDLCKAKGFDAMEPDNLDGYVNATGFPLTYQDQLTFNKWVAGAAHARGLSVGLKNDLDQIPDLLGSFDWALDEQCFEYSECDSLTLFIRAGKAVFEVEYNGNTSDFCSKANALGINSMKKRLRLDAWRKACQ